MIDVRVLYFAQFADDSGKPDEILQIAKGSSASDLFDKLQERYTLSLDKDQCRVAVNERFVSWDTQLEANDTLALIPPVTGG